MLCCAACRIRTTRDQLDDQIQKTDWFLRHGHIPPEAVQQNQELLASLRQQRDQIKKDHSLLLQVRRSQAWAAAAAACCLLQIPCCRL